MRNFVIKRVNSLKPQKINDYYPTENENNQIKEDKKVMTTDEKIAMAQDILNGANPSQRVKRVKKDKGLIERTESSKTILTEDNKELLND